MTKEETVEKPFQGHRVTVESVAISSDRKIIALRLDDGTIRIWNAETKEFEGELLPPPRNTVNLVAVSSNGPSIALCLDDGTFRIWNVEMKEVPTVRSVAVSDDRLATAELVELKGHGLEHKSAVECVAFSSDGSLIASASHDGEIRIWDAGTASPVEFLESHGAAVKSLAFSPNGEYIVSGSEDKTVGIWDVERRKLIGQLIGHEAAVNSVAFSPDGAYIVSGSDDQTVRIWDVKRRKLIGRPLQGHTASIQFVSFSDDGKRIVSGAWDMNGHMAARTWDAATVVVATRPKVCWNFGELLITNDLNV
jgi:WD40 repeat protein